MSGWRRALVAALLTPAIALAVSCAAAAPTATHTVYQYSLAGPSGDFRPGDTVPLEWQATPQVVSGSPSGEKARVCVAVVGPYADVTALKASSKAASACPIAQSGVVVESEALVVDLLTAKPVDQPLILPATLAPGYYSVLSVLSYGTTDTGNSMSASGIIHVVNR